MGRESEQPLFQHAEKIGFGSVVVDKGNKLRVIISARSEAICSAPIYYKNEKEHFGMASTNSDEDIAGYHQVGERSFLQVTRGVIRGYTEKRKGIPLPHNNKKRIIKFLAEAKQSSSRHSA